MLASEVAQLKVTLWSEVKTPPAGMELGVAVRITASLVEGLQAEKKPRPRRHNENNRIPWMVLRTRKKRLLSILTFLFGLCPTP